MRPVLHFCAQITLLAVLATSSKVSVKAPHSSSKLTSCGSPTVDVVFQTVIAHASEGTPILFKHYWVPAALEPNVMKRLPDPVININIRDCTNSIAAAGHDAFEFSNGNCTAVELKADLCCNEVSGSHIYVSELFNGSSGVISPSNGVIIQRFPAIVDISTMIDASSSRNENDLQPGIGKAAWQHSDGKIYTFPVDYIDVANCIGQGPCDPFISYNRNLSISNSPLYLTDYCGSSMPVPFGYDQTIISHRGFGCEYMPNELLGNDCVVKIDYSCNCVGNIRFFDYIEGDSCDGLSLVAVKMNSAGQVTSEEEMCDSKINYFGGDNDIEFRLSLTKPDRLGFVIGHIAFNG